jgi:dTDP-4-dehydrorhamnose reductase
MSIAVVGAAGQLGRDLCLRLGSVAVPLGHDQIELTDPACVHQAISAVRPRVVVNTAAYNLVDQAEDDVARAFAVNAFGARYLAETCQQLDCMLVHLSSDYVFGADTSRDTPYLETDTPGPVGSYGLSKLAGEYFVRAYCPRHVVIRTCGLYGRPSSGGKGRNFVETMLRLGRERGRVRVVHDQQCTPSYTVDVAEVIAQLIAAEQCGLYHVTNGGSCTWFELACELFRQAGMAVACEPITTAEFGSRAPRPAYSVLGSARLAAAGIAPPRDWPAALAAYLADRSP